MEISYATLSKNYYSYDETSADYKNTSDFYKELGIDIDNLLAQSDGYANTCAARVSLALIKSGASFSGRLPNKSGPHVGKKLLADQLTKPEILGRPEIHKPDAFLGKIRGRRGIVFFFKIEGYGAGSGSHIDLIDHSTASAVCASACYYNSKEIWFWPPKDDECLKIFNYASGEADYLSSGNSLLQRQDSEILKIQRHSYPNPSSFPSASPANRLACRLPLLYF